MDRHKKYKYCVVEILDSPQLYRTYGRFVCVPSCWVFQESLSDDAAMVKHPVEDIEVTKRRVKKRENYENSWPFFIGNIIHGYDSYQEAKEHIKALKKCFPDKEMRHAQTKRSDTTSSHKHIIKSNQSSETSKTEKHISTKPVSNKGQPGGSYEEGNKKQNEVPEAANSEDTTNTNSRPEHRRNEPDKPLSPATSEESLEEDIIILEIPKGQSNYCIQHSNNCNCNGANESSANQTTTDKASKPQLFFNPNQKAFSDSLKKMYSKLQNSFKIIDQIHSKIREDIILMADMIKLVDKLDNLNIEDTPATIGNEGTGKKENEHIKVKFVRDSGKLRIQEDQNKGQKNKQKEKENNENEERMDINKDDETQKGKNETPLNPNLNTYFEGRRFTLPAEYDEKDSKWTLRYRKKKKGLVELMPYSNVYVDAIRLNHCKMVSKDSRTFARMLLVEVFTKSALSTCSWTGKRAMVFGMEAEVRPGLNELARTVLLNYVEKWANDNNWERVDLQSIIVSIRNKIQDMRNKYGRNLHRGVK